MYKVSHLNLTEVRLKSDRIHNFFRQCVVIDPLWTFTRKRTKSPHSILTLFQNFIISSTLENIKHLIVSEHVKGNTQKTIVHDSNHILKLFKTLTSRGIKNTRACSVSGKFEKQWMKNLGVFHYLGAWKLSLYCLFFDFPFHPVNLCIARRRINQPVTVRRNNKSAFSKRAAEGACFFCRGRKAAAFDPRNSIEIYETRRSFNAWYPPRS